MLWVLTMKYNGQNQLTKACCSLLFKNVKSNGPLINDTPLLSFGKGLLDNGYLNKFDNEYLNKYEKKSKNK
jgi:hypothetical protein